MPDIARLGLAVDSSQVEKGTVTLHQLTGAAGQAQAAANRLAGATHAEAAGHKAAAAAAHVHNAALMAQNNVMRSSMQQRTMMIYQLNDVAVSLASGMNPAMVAMQQGSQILQGGLAPALRTIGDLAKTVVTRFWPIAAVVGVVGTAFGALTNEINRTAETQVSVTDVMLASWQMLSEQVAKVFEPLVTAASELWDQVTPYIAGGINNTIGLFIGGVEAIKAVWGVLPEAMGFVAYEASANVVNTFVKMIADVQASMNDMFSGIDSALVRMGGKSIMPRFDLQQTQSNYVIGGNPYSGAADAVGAAKDAFSSAMGQDYVGMLGDRAQEIARARAETDELGGAADKANEKVKKLANEGLELVKGALSGIGSGLWGAIRKGGDILGNIMEMLMSKVDNLIGKLLDNGFDELLFGANGGSGILGSLFGGGGFAGNPLSLGAGGPGFAGGGASSWGSLPSFDGGGWTGSGPRSGGLDGKGGFLALMHPRERVSDTTKGQGGGTTVENHFHNSPPVIREETTETPTGRRNDIYFDQMVASAVAKPGSQTQRAMRAAGRSPLR